MAEPVRFFRFPNVAVAEELAGYVDDARRPNWTDGITNKAMAQMEHANSDAVCLYGNGRHVPTLLEHTSVAFERTAQQLIDEGGWPLFGE